MPKITEDDKLTGLDLGADDYVIKPFGPRELVARIRTVLRRIGKKESQVFTEIRFDDLVIDCCRYEVWVRGKQVSLTPTEFKLLEVLAREPRQAFNRLDLLDKVLGCDFEGFE